MRVLLLPESDSVRVRLLTTPMRPQATKDSRRSTRAIAHEVHRGFPEAAAFEAGQRRVNRLAEAIRTDRGAHDELGRIAASMPCRREPGWTIC